MWPGLCKKIYIYALHDYQLYRKSLFSLFHHARHFPSPPCHRRAALMPACPRTQLVGQLGNGARQRVTRPFTRTPPALQLPPSSAHSIFLSHSRPHFRPDSRVLPHSSFLLHSRFYVLCSLLLCPSSLFVIRSFLFCLVFLFTYCFIFSYSCISLYFVTIFLFGSTHISSFSPPYSLLHAFQNTHLFFSSNSIFHEFLDGVSKTNVKKIHDDPNSDLLIREFVVEYHPENEKLISAMKAIKYHGWCMTRGLAHERD